MGNRIEYAILIFKNSLLMIKYALYNSRKSINDLIDLYNRLSKGHE